MAKKRKKKKPSIQSKPKPVAGDGTEDRPQEKKAGSVAGRRAERKPSSQIHPKRAGMFALLVFVVAVVSYAQSLSFDFTLDDIPIIKEKEEIRSLVNIPELYRLNYWGLEERFPDKGLYRPFTVTTYALNYAVHELRPMGYHLVNILLHAIASLLLFLLVRDLFENVPVAVAAGLWFAVHPIHTEAVCGVVGRAELLSFTGVALCMWCYIRGMLADEAPRGRGSALFLTGSVLAYMMGMLSKEIGVVAPAGILAAELILPSRRWLLRMNIRAAAAFAGYVAAAALFLFMRSQAILSRVMNVGFKDVATPDRIMTALRICAEYVGLLLFPVGLSADYPAGDVRISSSVADVGVLLAVVLLAAAFILAAWSWKRHPAIVWGILLFSIALFPVSNLPFPIGVMKAERILYAPSAGFLVALAAVLYAVLGAKKELRYYWIAVGVIGALLLAGTFRRSPDWKDNFQLAQDTLKAAPSSVIFNSIMFNHYRSKKQNDEARPYAYKALELEPENKTSLLNCGNLELDEKNYDKAIEHYRRLIEVDPRNSSGLNNLGRALSDARRYDEAIEIFEKLRQRRPDHPGAYINLVAIYMARQNPSGALPIMEAARQRFPNHPAVQWNAFAVYQALGRKQEAEQAQKKAIQLDPKIAGQRDVRSHF